MEVHIDPPPNAGLAAIFMGAQMKSGMLVFARQAAQLYRSRVAKLTFDLADHTTASTAVMETRWGPRHIGRVTVDSEHFLPHEEGWTDEDGTEHPGAHDFNEILHGMAGI